MNAAARSGFGALRWPKQCTILQAIGRLHLREWYCPEDLVTSFEFQSWVVRRQTGGESRVLRLLDPFLGEVGCDWSRLECCCRLDTSGTKEQTMQLSAEVVTLVQPMRLCRRQRALPNESRRIRCFIILMHASWVLANESPSVPMQSLRHLHHTQ